MIDERDAGPDADERILMDVVQALDAVPARTADIERLVREHPHLEQRIRHLVDVHGGLAAVGLPADAPPPERLGEFRIVRRIAAGGMGEVYEAWQESLQRRVAIKLLRRGRHSEEARERFLREQQVLARLHQTHIVPIHAAGREGECEYFVMPYIDGAALRHVVDAAAEFGSRSPGARTPGIGELVCEMRSRVPHRDVESPPTHGLPAPRPSTQYLRSAALVMADAAMAVQHAHEEGVLHRDIKPSNIMVEAHALADGRRADQCWVIDFGLSGYLASRPAGPPDASHPLVSGVMGTPSYMAPEQFEQRADERTDVWGLGVTLYEVLTLQRAFPEPAGAAPAERLASLREGIARGQPARARWRLPRDLAAICSKAMQTKPERRYASARALADDLRRWLAGEMVEASREEAPLRALPVAVARWANRHRGWAAALLLGVASCMVVGRLMYVTAERDSRAQALRGLLLKREHSEDQIREPGWSASRLALIKEISREGVDAFSQGAYLRYLAEPDAYAPVSIRRRASSLAFDGLTGELLLGGAPDEQMLAALPAAAWHDSVLVDLAGPAAHGPIAVLGDGTRVQLVHAEGPRFRLWDVTRGSGRDLEPLEAGGPGLVEPSRNELGLPVLALSANGTVAAAATQGPREDGPAGATGVLGAWDVRSGKLIRRLTADATALALSADGAVIAAGDRHGRVSVWTLPEGRPLAVISLGEDEVQSLAFGPNPLDPPRAGEPLSGLRVAAGCAGGEVLVWSPGSRSLPVRCQGLEHRVLALDFSADGTLLAAAGARTMLWDSSTGERLLRIPGTYVVAVAFSSKDDRLALSDYAAFGQPGQVIVWNLEASRGIRALRGLAARAQLIAFSRDGRRLAALSADWTLAVWDCRSGGLLRAFAAPRGYSSDNAGLAFSPDGSQLACLTGQEARLWDVTSGELLAIWILPPGLTDALAFADGGELFSARCENLDSRRLEPSRTGAACRVRRLLPDGTTELIGEHVEFDARIVSLALDPRARWLVIEGDCAVGNRVERRLKGCEVVTGRELWPAMTLAKTKDVSSLAMDPTGGLLAFSPAESGSLSLLALPSGAMVEPAAAGVSLGPGATIQVGPVGEDGCGIFRKGAAEPAAVISDTLDPWVRIDPGGSWVAWGSNAGPVMLASLEVLLECRTAVSRGP